MSRPLLLFALVFATVRPLVAQDEPPADTSAGLPKEYADYLIAQSTLSPDKKFAVIYPKLVLCEDDPQTSPRCKDYLVALKPFEILTTLQTRFPQFQNKNHGGISGAWSPDGNAVLVTLDSKWGPEAVFLCELHGGKVTRSTDLLLKVEQLFVPDYKASKVGPLDKYAFVIESPVEGEFAAFTDATHVRLRAVATTDPKSSPGRKAWEAELDARWDIPQARFASQKVKRTFLGLRREED